MGMCKSTKLERFTYLVEEVADEHDLICDW